MTKTPCVENFFATLSWPGAFAIAAIALSLAIAAWAFCKMLSS